MAIERGRFAPSITGQAHPGTLLAALLCWLDARANQREFLVRLEDLDHTRLRAGHSEMMLEALAWLGLDWDGLTTQSKLQERHAAALDDLDEQGLLYPCQCSRKQRRQHARPAPDGGFAYGNRCRERELVGGWRECAESVRVRLPESRVLCTDGSGADLSQSPASEMGDPIVRRADGVVAYHLVVVVDDAASGISHVVRGRDLAASTATQIHLQSLLGLPHPQYHHHFLLMESRGQKLAKLHGSIPFETLRENQSGAELCGQLAHTAGLRDTVRPCSPHELIDDFAWSRVRTDDVCFGDAPQPT